MKSFVIFLYVSIVVAVRAVAQPLTLSNYPLLGDNNFPSRTMFVVGRDHQIFKPAYTIFSDANGDGEWDFDFKPNGNYRGIFSAKWCYRTIENRGFIPINSSEDGRCSGRHEWSGAYLNYLTTSRIDLFRVLWYGGHRHEDSAQTWLRRARFTFRSSGWSLSYESPVVNGYDIRDYAPLPLPSVGHKHLLANGDLADGPVLMVKVDSDIEPWEWIEQLADETDVCAGSVVDTRCSNTLTAPLLVQVCQEPFVDSERCRLYRGLGGQVTYKPFGLLHDLAAQTQAGLLTGSYDRPTSGGVLRLGWSDINDYIDPRTGVFNSDVSFMSVVDRLDALADGCTAGNRLEQQCSFSGNPLAEMMWEALRYHYDDSGPTAHFASGSVDRLKGLPSAPWTRGHAQERLCAAKNMWLISGGLPTDDVDQLPGSFGRPSAVAALEGQTVNTSASAQLAWREARGGSVQALIGQQGAFVGAQAGLPTRKRVFDLNVSGFPPDQTQLRGGYYSAVLSYVFGERTARFSPYVVTKAMDLEGDWRGRWYAKAGFLPVATTTHGCDGLPLEIPRINSIRSAYSSASLRTPMQFSIALDFADNPRHPSVSDAIVNYSFDRARSALTIQSLYSGHCQQLAGITASLGARYDVDLGVAVRGSADTALVRDLTTADTQLSQVRVHDLSAMATASVIANPLFLAATLSTDAEYREESVTNYFTVDTIDDLSGAAFRDHKLTQASSQRINSVHPLPKRGDDSIIILSVFDPSNWTGDLIAYEMYDRQGDLVEMDNGIPRSRIVWEAQREMTQWLARGGQRNVFTRSSTGHGVGFDWNALSTLDQHQLLGKRHSASDGRALIGSLNGHDLSRFSGYNFRDFAQVPTRIMLPPAGDRLARSYAEFKRRYSGRPPTVFTFSNDGQLHAIDATNGRELFAYIPSMLFPKLNEAIRYPSDHPMMLNGDITVGDVQIDGRWRTILVASLGAAGKGLFALDVTNPEAFSSEDVLWEITSPAIDMQPNANLGHIFAGVSLVKGPHGRWMVVSGNGLNAQLEHFAQRVGSPGHASLVFIDVESGELTRVVDFQDGSSRVGLSGLCKPNEVCAKANGMGPPAVVDLDGDGAVDTVYSGDAYGNIWRTSIESAQPHEWGSFYQSVDHTVPLFTTQTCDRLSSREGRLECGQLASRVQPILTRPQVSRLPNEEGGADVLIAVGTGKAVEPNEFTVESQSVQSLYVIRDDGSWDGRRSPVLRREQLQQQMFLNESSLGSSIEGAVVRTSSSETVDYDVQRGWVLDLASGSGSNGFDLSVSHGGERLLASATLIYGDRVRIVSAKPELVGCRSVPQLWETTLRLVDGHPILDIGLGLGQRFESRADRSTLISSVHFPIPDESAMSEIPLILTDSGAASLWPSTSFYHQVAPSLLQTVLQTGRQSWRELAR